MAVIKCKMCGGDMELSADKTFGTCEYCGSTMTLPKVEDEQRAAQFNRGNHFRRSGEFDKALAIYERIVAENDDDAEAHWCCALSRFGIEYVEDPNTYEYLPTCHRASFDSFLEDVDYLAALEHSDGITKRQYQKDAAKIADVQKGILATSQNEEPFDVFICYKESDDATGQRTVDSTLAQDIYYQLTEEGYRVFFSRITLEDKVGTEYEPYIFAALNSAKVMISIGTKPEHFNAVWVKNEWSRFLAMMRKDRSKLLLPCYRDMDPYDLPEQLSVLQSYDMSKIGFMQDLIRGIKKVLRKDEPKAEPVKETVVVQQSAGGSNVTALLKRGNMALEDGEWKQAKDYFDQVLNADAENAEAYLGLLLAEHGCSGLPQYVEEMKDAYCEKRAEKKVALQADEARIKAAEKEYVLGDFLTAKDIRSVFSGFDFMYPSYVKSCIQNRRRAETDLNAEKNLVRARQFASGELKQMLESAVSDILKHYDALTEQAKKDESAAAEQKRQAYAEFLTQKEEVIKAKYEQACAIREKDYQTAVQAQEKADTPEAYERAARMLRALNGYQDSAERENACREAAARLKTEQQTKEAAAAKKRKKAFAIGTPIVAVCIAFLIVLTTVIIPNSKYNAAVSLMDEGKYDEAIAAFEAVNRYKDSKDKASECQFLVLKSNLSGIKKGDTIKFGFYEQDNNTTNGKEEIEWIVLNVEGSKALVISKYALDCKPYNSSDTYVTWEKCTLRKWLNDSFLNTAFIAKHQELIPSVSVSADKNPNCSTNPGNATTDKVFLLSITEAEKYFTTGEACKCAPTAYANSQGARTSDSYETASGEATCYWWLRSPGYDREYAASVDSDGSVSYFGDDVDRDFEAVRPALWINLPN